MSKSGEAFGGEPTHTNMVAEDATPGERGGDPRGARMNRVWQKHLRGELVTLEEFLARRRGR
jgi:hypothetical protein